VHLSPGNRKRLWIALCVAPLLVPGWRGVLVPVGHDEILRESARHAADDVFGASRRGERAGETWNIQYMGGRWAALLDRCGLRGFATRVAPPQFAAHVPPGPDGLPERADGYYRVETSWRWPWWWPGGGVDWRVPS
jgi:hypothetical protein